MCFYGGVFVGFHVEVLSCVARPFTYHWLRAQGKGLVRCYTMFHSVPPDFGGSTLCV